MTYTITTECHEDGIVTLVRAELHNADDFTKLIKVLFEYRDQRFPQQKEEPT